MSNEDLEKLAEEVVDAVAEKLGVDTGICSQGRFEQACEAAEECLRKVKDWNWQTAGR